ncbi:MAG: hypothetical protein GC161_18820 [Planctomycetaceae bacterium]|nr:hypothetical protein [Planctomycetaceae bacterium]
MHPPETAGSPGRSPFDGSDVASVLARGAAESSGAFGGFVGPRTLLAQVAVGAPYLFDARCPRAGEVSVAHESNQRAAELVASPLGWWRALLADPLDAQASPSPADIADYFALCLAAHWASAPSYVPTDVDAKIRRALWADQTDPAERARMYRLVHGLEAWDNLGFSARVVDAGPTGDVFLAPREHRIDGLDGERLGVLCGALVDARARADAGDSGAAADATAFEDAVDRELAREAQLFLGLLRAPGRERDLLTAAALLAHNAGDVNQGLAAAGKGLAPKLAERFLGLVQSEGAARLRYGGAFARAGELYRQLLAAEGHRHYPLRQAHGLRSHPSLLLPVGPFLDDFGARVATFEARPELPGSFAHGFLPFGPKDRAEFVVALVEGVKRVPGQAGYQRALAGFEAAHPGGFQAPDLSQFLPSSVRKALERGPLRKELDVPRRSFESSLAKRARA